MRTIYYLSFVITTMLGCSINMAAQNKPVRLGIKGGINFSNSTTKVDDISYGLNGKETKAGYQVGMTVDFEVSKTFYFQSGLSFTTKGIVFKDEESWGSNPNIRKYKDSNTNLSYLQLPFMGAYKINLTPDTRFVIFAGPYLAYGIGGKIKFDTTFSLPGGYQANIDDLNSFGERTFKRFDFGLSSGIGVEFKNYCLNFNYEWGLSNINRDSYNSDIIILFHREYKNRNASLTLGYKF